MNNINKLLSVRRLVFCFLVQLLVLFSLSGKVLAAWVTMNCSETDSPYITVPISGSGLNVGRDVSVGSVLATYTANIPNPNAILTCSRSPICYTNWPVTYTFTPTPTPVSGMNFTYQTNVAGIGYRIVYGGNYLNLTSSTTASSWCGSTSQFATYSIQFIKTGSVAAGASVNLSTLATFSYIVGTNNLLAAQYAPSAGVIPVSPTGTCQTPNVTVNLGTAVLKNFQGIGQPISAAGTAFNISLNNCPAGLNSIQYYLTPNTTTSSYTGVVALDSSSTASGVGVQLLNSAGTAISFNTNYSLVYSGAGSYTIPMIARYYQTGSTVTAGAANTSLTFTMIYQ